MYKCDFIDNIKGAKGYVIDTRTSAGITSSKVKGGGIEDPLCYPRWKRINRPKDSGPTRYYYLLDSFSKVSFLLSISTPLKLITLYYMIFSIQTSVFVFQLMEACTGGNGAVVVSNNSTSSPFDAYSSGGTNSR